jgi:hypothetical protein
MSAADAAPPPAGSSPGPGDGGSSDKGEDTDVDAVTGLPVSFSGIFNTQVTDTNVPTVLSKLQKWGDYESYGEPVGPSRFIPMKTPLSPTLLADFGVGNGDRADDPSDANGEPRRVRDEESNASRKKNVPHVHTLPAFLEAQKKKGRDVGLVIDLSNHDCLYTDGIPDTGVKRVHVRNVAKSVPGLDSVKEAIAGGVGVLGRKRRKPKKVRRHPLRVRLQPDGFRVVLLLGGEVRNDRRGSAGGVRGGAETGREARAVQGGVTKAVPYTGMRADRICV